MRGIANGIHWNQKALSVSTKLVIPLLSRRAFVFGAISFTLAGCVSTRQPSVDVVKIPQKSMRPVTPLMYAAIPDEQFPIPEVDVSKVAEKWWRTDVDYLLSSTEN